MQTLIKNPSEIFRNGPKMETLGAPVALWGALGTILTPKATQRQKRPEDTGSLVAFGPPFLCPLGPLFGTGTSHGAVCVVFWGSFCWGFHFNWFLVLCREPKVKNSMVFTVSNTHCTCCSEVPVRVTFWGHFGTRILYFMSKVLPERSKDIYFRPPCFSTVLLDARLPTGMARPKWTCPSWVVKGLSWAALVPNSWVLST